MNEIEKENQVEGLAGNDNDLDLLEEIKNLKANSVSKEEYTKLQEKNKILMKQIINGGGTKQEAEENVDINELRQNIFGNPEALTNRDFWVNTLKLRKERLEKEGVDIFAPRGVKTRYTRDDLASAENLAEVMQHLIDDTADNPTLFNILLKEAIN